MTEVLVVGAGPAGLLLAVELRLDSYHHERHTAGAHVLANTRAPMLLAEADDQLEPLADLLARVAAHPSGNRAFTEIITGLDTHYDMDADPDHPWLGRLAPNLALTGEIGDTDVVTLLSSGRGLLLDLTGDNAVRESATGWADRS